MSSPGKALASVVAQARALGVRELVADAVAAARDWGLSGILKRANLEYVLHRWAVRRLDDEDQFDLKYGTETTRKVRTSRYGMSPHLVRGAIMYWPSTARTVERILSTLDVRAEEFVFIDFGSGKGRVLLLASRWPFKRIVGVELSPSMHARAIQNAEIYKDENQLCRAIELVCSDARSYELPLDPLVIYFFHPFDQGVLTAVLRRILDSLRRHPRTMYIAYLDPQPECRAAFATTGEWEEIASSSPEDAGDEYIWFIYKPKET